jgi:hypothetical protein
MRIALRWAVLALAAAACANQQTPEVRSPHTTNVVRENIVIQFGDMEVTPAVARVKHGGSVAWTSVSTNFRGTLSFPESIVQHFSCKELRPDFFVAEGRLESIPLGGGGEDVVLPCPLARGTYEYRIDLTSGGEGVGGRSMGENPQLTLPATLIVE